MNNDQDPLLKLYRELDTPEPPEAVDRAILAHARASNTRPWHHAPQVIWPLSAAAALVLAVGVISQIAPMLPAPGHSEIHMPGPIQVPRPDPLPPEPPVGQEHPKGTSGMERGVLEFRSDVATSEEDLLLAPVVAEDYPPAIEVSAWREAAEIRARVGEADDRQNLDLLRQLVAHGTDAELLSVYAEVHDRWPTLVLPQELSDAIAAARQRSGATDPID